jgi:outer membrane protein assembly factor BamB
VAVRAGGSGDVSSSHVVWQQPKSKLRLGSGVIHEGHFYVNDMQGVATCFDLLTGKEVWEKRLTAGGTGDTWSSMVLTADELIYMLNQVGETFVIKASPEFEQVAANPLNEQTNSSIVISDGEIFIRTHEHLWCVGE